MHNDGTAPASPHGGPDAQGVPTHDFSTNANACGPCPEAMAALRAVDPAHYPDPAYVGLCERLAGFHGVAPWRIVVAASASEFIARVTEAVALAGRGEVRVPAQAYGDYRRAAEARGLRVVLEHVPATGVPTRLRWRCDPATPLGQGADGLVAWIDATPDGAMAVLDRAYAPLRLRGVDALDQAPGRADQVWQLWSPNKALGLTGVRGAYAIAPLGAEAMAPQLRALAPSWPLGVHAVAMLEAWAGAPAQQWVAASLPTLRQWKARQVALLRGLGWEPLPSDANFHAARPPAGADLAPLLTLLRAQGIKLRDCASFGLPGHVRLGVRPPHSQDALGSALEMLRG